MSIDADSSELDKLEYKGHIPAVDDVQREALAIWQKAWAQDAQLRKQVRPEHPDGEAPPLPLEFEVTAGVDPASITLIVIAAPVAKKMAMDVWRRIILPKLERKWGEGSLRPSSRSKDKD